MDSNGDHMDKETTQSDSSIEADVPAVKRCKTSNEIHHIGLNQSDDARIRSIEPLIPPQILVMEVPVSLEALSTVTKARRGVEDILSGRDDRLVVVIGPCSIHDIKAAKEYGHLLHEQIAKHSEDLLIVMRVYFEKPRTTVGWKGLLNDPELNGSFHINKGLKLGRQLLLDLNTLGVPCGVEFLDTITPQWLADLVAWGAIGARTTESQIHRELASGLSCPVGFKNGTSGNTTIALDAMKAASHPHSFLSVTKQGLSAIVHSKGNPYTHIILRGGTKGPNYNVEHVSETSELMKKVGLLPSIMIDCLHDNSLKIHTNQPKVARVIADQIADGSHNIKGVMVESHLVEGKQSIPKCLDELIYGQSVTDACIGWDD